jgi:hypothetical protein
VNKIWPVDRSGRSGSPYSVSYRVQDNNSLSRKLRIKRLAFLHSLRGFEEDIKVSSEEVHRPLKLVALRKLQATPPKGVDLDLAPMWGG